MKIIDPHLHFFAIQRGKYEWLKQENPPFWPLKETIVRNFDESSLALSAPLELSGYVHIEAGFDNDASWRELAHWQSQSTLSFRGVQHADVTAPADEFFADLQQGQASGALVGVRHIVDSPDILTHKNTLTNLQQLAKANVLFELQCDLKCAKNASICTDVLGKVPELSVSLNHVGFIPRRDSSQYRSWLSHFKALVQHPYLAVKVSGLEMRQQKVDQDDILRSLDPCLNETAIEKIMIASNFPLVTFTHSYDSYWQMVVNAVETLGVDTQLLVASNAHEHYFARKIRVVTEN